MSANRNILERELITEKKVLFVWPNVPGSKYLFNFLPLGIGYLAANLPPKYEIRMWDGVLNGKDNETVLSEIERCNPDFIVFSIWIFNYECVCTTAALIKQKYPEITITAGGPEISANAVHIMDKNSCFDFALVGEGDFVLEKILTLPRNIFTDGIDSLNKIGGLVYRNHESEIVSNPPVWDDISEVKFCDYKFINFEEYLKRGYKYGFFSKEEDSAPILATRGCPYSCEYCSARQVNGLKVRKRAIPSIIKEIAYLNKEYKIRHFNIIDDNFTFDLDFAKEVCREIIKLNIDGIKFCSPNGIRMERLDKELLDLMKKAGWEWIFIAPESGSERTLKLMKKNLDLKRIPEYIKLIKSSGFKVLGFFIIGYPGETLKDILKTVFYAIRYGFDNCAISCFTPLPGTPIYKKLLASGEIGPMAHSSDYYKITYAPKGISVRTLSLIRFFAVLMFFLSTPRRIRILMGTKTLKDKYLYLKKLFFGY